MYKITLLIILTMLSSLSLADRGFSIIQVTNPEQNRIDIDYLTLFSLSDDEEKGLIRISNKGNLFTYDWLEKIRKV